MEKEEKRIDNTIDEESIGAMGYNNDLLEDPTSDSNVSF